jgi:FMN phosphatase YigB (HAD superfamily)
MIPEAVVFDLGKVLLDFDYSIAAGRIAARGRLSPEKVQDFIDHSPLLFRYETGLLTREQFFREVCATTGFGGGLEEFGGFFADIFTPIEPMVAIQRQLRAQRIPTYIFSNTNDLAISHIRRNFPFFAHFDGYVLSYEHGAMKPDHKLYEVVEKMAAKRGNRILFLDDRKENADAGLARNWQVIHHQNPRETLAILRKMGILTTDEQR